MKGICIQGGVRNANQRVYPVNEIGRAVTTLNDQIAGGYSVLGEVDHPEGLNINLDRVSHMITEMWMDGPNGYGKLKILPTPMGQLVRTMLEMLMYLAVKQLSQIKQCQKATAQRKKAQATQQLIRNL